MILTDVQVQKTVLFGEREQSRWPEQVVICGVILGYHKRVTLESDVIVDQFMHLAQLACIQWSVCPDFVGQ